MTSVLRDFVQIDLDWACVVSNENETVVPPTGRKVFTESQVAFPDNAISDRAIRNPVLVSFNDQSMDCVICPGLNAENLN